MCVYTVGDMHNIFMTSRFTGDKSSRSRQASVEADILFPKSNMINMTSLMIISS